MCWVFIIQLISEEFSVFRIGGTPQVSQVSRHLVPLLGR